MNLLPKPYDWNICMMEMAFSISKMSKDPSTKAGCVIVSPDKRRFALGYNGFPSDIPDYEEWWNNRDQDTGICKYDVVQHGEANAILQSKTDLTGWSLYTTHLPCLTCCTKIITAKIKYVYYYHDSMHMDLKPEKTKILYNEAGVICTQVHGNFNERSTK